MKRLNLQLPHRIAVAAIFGTLLITGPALHAQDKPTREKNKEEKEYKRDLDRELDKLETASENVRKLSSKDWTERQEELRKTLKNIDYEKNFAQAEAALKAVDFEKIQRSIESAFEAGNTASKLSKEQRAEIRREIEKARKEFDRDRKQQQEQLKRDLERARKDVEAATKKATELEKFDFKKTFEDAEEHIEKAKVELKGYQEMIYDMEAAGLLSTKGDYTISFNNGTLTITDKEQPKSIADKYSKYFKDKKTILKKENKKFVTSHE
ncbi:hypothetical protein HHL16_07870 [Pseudoflavitalea sp. G-6-1-2]|uniref:hypothetical protein n=1 Tax=Pseudoflavitalea sp. G-6-1-2 TaxID=2728841 RepID=UPI00146D8294|nr:hypothetical protein [Pseudoflavitalea sp. G-6-1-2]NML20787.1 hypothetical protein [Pseudoflavitalea sp. G-6-1-2]